MFIKGELDFSGRVIAGLYNVKSLVIRVCKSGFGGASVALQLPAQLQDL